jgi:hypothetical protein
MAFKNTFPLIKKKNIVSELRGPASYCCLGKPLYLWNDVKHLNVFVVLLGGLFVDVVIAVFLKVSTRNLCVQ